MKILDMDIKIDKLPDGCNVNKIGDTSCIFNTDKYCILKIALKQKNTFVHNNRGFVPLDCPLRRENIKMATEIELNRGWIIDHETDEVIGETNFVVPFTWLQNKYEQTYKERYADIFKFLDVYEPEVEGEYIYQEALKEKVLIEDLGVVIYEKY